MKNNDFFYLLFKNKIFVVFFFVENLVKKRLVLISTIYIYVAIAILQT